MLVLLQQQHAGRAPGPIDLCMCLMSLSLFYFSLKCFILFKLLLYLVIKWRHSKFPTKQWRSHASAAAAAADAAAAAAEAVSDGPPSHLSCCCL